MRKRSPHDHQNNVELSRPFSGRRGSLSTIASYTLVSILEPPEYRSSGRLLPLHECARHRRDASGPIVLSSMELDPTSDNRNTLSQVPPF